MAFDPPVRTAAPADAITLGRVAFDAYRTARGGVNHDGTPTPTWDALTAAVRDGWEFAAEAVVEESIRRLRRRLTVGGE